MEDVYKKLADFLDKLPGGYPATESGVELRILEKLFNQEEAKLAMALTPIPEAPVQIAGRLRVDPVKLAEKLDAMSKKGLVNRHTKDGLNLYMALQFFIGMYEAQINVLNKDLIADLEEYLPCLLERITSFKTKQLRVIPVSQSVSGDLAVMPYELAKEIVLSQSKIVVIPCICRTEQKMAGRGCDSPLKNCLSFGSTAFYYEGNGLGKSITKEEALALLEEGLKAGLVLQPTNAQKTLGLCMCCSCCCGILGYIRHLKNPAAAVSSNYFSVVTEGECTACGNCTEICPMNAITIDEAARIDIERCIGCGLCVAKCDFHAIKLTKKANPDIPPASIFETFTRIAKERGLA
jgi:electron transport complex protein RnfB